MGMNVSKVLSFRIFSVFLLALSIALPGIQAADQVLVAPVRFLKSPYSGNLNGSIPADYTQEQIRQHWTTFWADFWSVMSYGKYRVEVTVADYAFMPWPIQPLVGGGGFVGGLTEIGEGEDLGEEKSGVVDGVFTPGERYRDMNGDGKYTRMEEWWDTKENFDEDSKSKKYDAYGEEFVDWNRDGLWTAGNATPLAVYDAYLDIGPSSDNLTERLYGDAGDGLLGGINLATGNLYAGSRPAIRSVFPYELDVNRADHFSIAPIPYSGGPLGAANLTGDREWVFYWGDKNKDMYGGNLVTQATGIDWITTPEGIEASGNFTPLVIAGTNIFSKVGAVSIRRVDYDISSYNTTIYTEEYDLYRSPEMFIDENGNELWDDRDEFEDFLVRWEAWYNPNGAPIPPGGWVPVSGYYIDTNYPSSDASKQLVADRFGNQQFDGSDEHVEAFNQKMRVRGWDGRNAIMVANWDPHDFLGFGNDLSAVDQWFRVNYGGTLVGGVGIVNSRWGDGASWISWNAEQYDTYGGGGLVDPTNVLWPAELPNELSYIQNTAAANVRGGYPVHRQFGAVEDPDNPGVWSTDNVGAGAMTHGGWDYDSPREFDDLPSSIYHMPGYYLSGGVPEGPLLDLYVRQIAQQIGFPAISGTGDGRLGEVTGPQSNNINGADLGINDPQLAMDEDDMIVLAGPLAYNIHGDNGWDSGSVMALELITWATDGGDNIDMTEDFINRDVNLDGMVDQGFSPPAGFNNYTLGRGLSGGDGDGQAEDEGYPFNRGRFFEDVIESLDEFLDYDKFSERDNIVDYLVPTLGPGEPGGFGGPSGLWVYPLTLDSPQYFGVNGFPHNDALGGGLIAHEMSHDKWGTQDLYDYDVWNGIQESFPIGAFDRMATGGWTKTPVSKIIVSHPDGPFAEARDLRDFLIPGEEQTVEMLPVDYEENEKNYFWFGRGKDLGYSIGNEGFFFYYDSGVSDYTMGHTGIQIVHQDGGVNAEGSFLQQRQGSHFKFEIVEADASGKMRDGFSNGDVNSVFNDKQMQGRTTFKTTFNMEEFPKSAWWDGDDSGIEIIDIDVPTQPDEFTPTKVTFLWKNQLVPTLSFIDPPGGASVGSDYSLKIDAWDRYGESKIHMYIDYDDEGYDGIPADGWGEPTSLDKAISGEIKFSKAVSLANVPDGGAYFYGFIDPRDYETIEENLEKQDYTLTYVLPRLKVGDKGSMVALAGGNAFEIESGVGPHLSSLQRFTLSCNFVGASGEATFTVEGSLTGMEPGLLTVGESFITQNDYTGSHNFLVTPGPSVAFTGNVFFALPGTSAAVTGEGTTFTTDISAGDYVNVGGKSFQVAVNPGSDSSMIFTEVTDLPLTGKVTSSLNSQYLFGYGSNFDEELSVGDNIWFDGNSYTVEEINNFSLGGIPDLVTVTVPSGYDGLLKLSTNILSARVPIYDSQADYEAETNALGTGIVTADSDYVMNTSVDLSAETSVWISGEQYFVSVGAADNLQLDSAIEPLQTNFTTHFHGGSYFQEQSFGLDDTFYVYTTGLTPYSEAILVRDNIVVEEDPNAVELVSSPMTGDVAEGGTQATFALRLNTRPTADVIVTVINPREDEATVDKESIIFTPDVEDTFAYWKLQTITVTGVDDELTDGDQEFQFSFSISSDDPDYDGLASTPVDVVNVDDESFGLSISADRRLVAESDQLQIVGATLDVSLRSRPTRDVVVYLGSSDPTEGVVVFNAANLLRFTPDNWNSSQEVFVSGNNDNELDGDQDFFVTFRLDSDDNNFNLLERDYNMTCVDDDVASVIVGEVSNDLYESGISGTFSVRLSQQPTDDVQVTLRSLQPSVAIVDVQQLVFSPTNYSTPQVVTIYPMENNDLPPNQNTGTELAIIDFDPLVSEGDANYNSLRPIPFAIEVYDNDDEGYTVSKITNNTDENGRTATFHVFLQTPPSGNVVIDVQSSDITEGTVEPSQLVFTPENWNGRQQVTVTGVDELLTDGSIPYTIYLRVDQDLTEDAGYSAKDPKDIQLFNIDNESAGIVIEPLDRVTDELRGRGSFRAYLTAQPTVDTTLVSDSSDTTEASFSTGTSQVVFDSSNYFIPKTIYINGVTDNDEDGNISFGINSSLSGDPAYEALTPEDIFMINLDKELPAVIVSPVSGDTSESGAEATFTVKLLKSLPENAKVFINLTASSEEIALDQTQLEFNENNYSSPQVVTITGQDDEEFDGAVPVYVTIEVDSTSYSTYLDARTPDIRLFNLDNDQPGLNIVGVDYTTSESGDTASFDISLFEKPTANLVKVNLSLSDDNEATLVGSPMIFLASTFSTPQTVTITGWEGADSTDFDGDVPYDLQIDIETSDVAYSALTIPNINLVNLDNDSPKVNFFEVGSTNVFSFENLSTDESGANVTFSVNLQVAGNLILALETSDNTEGNVMVVGSGLAPSDKAYVYFDASGNGYGDKTVVIEGVDDIDVDGDVQYTVDITVDPGTELTSPYLFEVFNNPVITNQDNDQAGIVFPTGVSEDRIVSGNTSESGNATTFEIALNSIPANNESVIISLVVPAESSGEISISPETIELFNKTPRTITVTGLDDSFDDGSQAVDVQIIIASDDPSYRDLPSQDPIIVYNDDDGDVAGFNVTVAETSIDEGTAVGVSVVLTSEPAENVSIQFSYSPIGSGSASSRLEDLSSVQFTPDNWNSTQTVTLQTIDNGQRTGTFTFVLEANTSSSDLTYDALDQQDTILQVIDDDNPGIDIVTISGNVDENERTAIMQVRLGAEPTQEDGKIVLDITSSDTGEIVVLDQVLEFDQTNWSAAQYVTLQGVSDNVTDGDQSVIITVSKSDDSVYTDIDYTIVPDGNLLVDNFDIDSPGIVFYDLTQEIDESGDGRFNSFRVGLKAPPTSQANVVLEFVGFVGANNLNPSANLEISDNLLSFDATDYNSGKLITLRSTEGLDIAGDESVTFVVQATQDLISGNAIDSNYVGGVVENLTFTIRDMDLPGIVVTTDSLVTSEAGKRVKVDVSLRSVPDQTVTMNLSVDRNQEARVTSSSLSFTASDYATPQTVYVEGLNDSDIDGAVSYNLRLETFGGIYENVVETLEMVNLDDDSASVRVLPLEDPTTAEWQADISIQLELSQTPDSDVSVGVSVSDDTEAYVQDGFETVVFTPIDGIYTANVMISGNDDVLADSHQSYRVIFTPLSSDDENFDGLTVDQVELLNYDDETSGIQVMTANGQGDLNTKGYNWGGESSVDAVSDVSGLSIDTFTVMLRSSPAFGSNVVINVSSSDTTEAVVRAADQQLVFDSSNFSTPQTVEVIGRDEETELGSGSYFINLEVDESTEDLFYRNFPDRGISGFNEDVVVEVTDDLAGTDAVLDLAVVGSNRWVTFSANGGLESYSWTLEDAPLGNDLVFEEGDLSTYVSGTGNSTLRVPFGLTTGLYTFSASDNQLDPLTEEFEIYVRGAPMVSGFSRPTTLTLMVYFEDISADDRTNYEVYHSQDGEVWRSLLILDPPQERAEESSKARKAAETTEYEMLVSFPQAGQPQGVGFFKIEATTLAGEEVPSLPNKAVVNSSPQYFPELNPPADSGFETIDDGNGNSNSPISFVSGGGGGGGGGCLLSP